MLLQIDLIKVLRVEVALTSQFCSEVFFGGELGTLSWGSILHRFKLKVNFNLKPKYLNIEFEVEYTLRCSLFIFAVYVICGLVLDGLYFWTVGPIYRIYFKTMHS